MVKAGLGVALGVVVKGKVPLIVTGVPNNDVSLLAVGVPAPSVAVNVSNTGFWVSVGVVACVGVSVGAGVTITGVILGTTV